MEKTSQTQALLGKFASNASLTFTNIGQTPTANYNTFTTRNQLVSNTIELVLVENFIDNLNITYDDKLAKTLAFYAQ